MLGYDAHGIYTLVLLVSSAIVVILSVLLMGIHMPKTEPWTKLRRAQKYLALSYLLLGLSGFVEIYYGEVSVTVKVLYTSFISAYEGLLFTATFLVILQPQYVKTRIVLYHLMAILTIGVVLSVICSQYGEEYPLAVIIPSIGIYLLQQGHYFWLFHKHYKVCLRRLEEYYDEDQHARLRWIKFSFYSAAFIGVFAISAALSGIWTYSVFIILYTIYYSYMTIRFNNYRLWANALVPVVSNAKVEEEVEENIHEDILSVSDDVDKTEFDALFAERLNAWVNEKGYLVKDLSVDEISALLGTDRNYLRYYFRTYIHTDFRTWRVELRVEEAKRIMREQPELSFTQIGEMVGFNHRSNFFNQFQKITGCSLSAFKDQISAEK